MTAPNAITAADADRLRRHVLGASLGPVPPLAAEPAGIVHFTGHTQVGGAPRALVGRVHP